MRLKLSPTRQPVAAARKRAYALYFDGAKRAYDAAWGVVLAHLPATAKCLHSPLAPFVAVYLDAHAAQRRYGIYGYELKCAETLFDFPDYGQYLLRIITIGNQSDCPDFVGVGNAPRPDYLVDDFHSHLCTNNQ